MAMISLGVRALRTFAARGFVASSASSSTVLRPFSTAGSLDVEVYNPSGEKRVVVTKMLPGTRWLDVLTKQLGARVEVLTDERHAKTIVPNSAIIELIGDKCDAVLGQLTEVRE